MCQGFFILIGNYLLLEWGVGYIFLVYDTYRENVGDGIGRFKLSHNIVGIFLLLYSVQFTYLYGYVNTQALFQVTV